MDCVLYLCLTYEKRQKSIPKCLFHFILIRNRYRFQLAHILISVSYCQTFQFNHLCEYAIVSHEILICIFLMTNMKLLFYVLICHLCIFIGKGSVQIICPYFFLRGGGCSRYQSSISYAFCKYFFPVCGLSFHFLNSVI